MEKENQTDDNGSKNPGAVTEYGLMATPSDVLIKEIMRRSPSVCIVVMDCNENGDKETRLVMAGRNDKLSTALRVIIDKLKAM